MCSIKHPLEVVVAFDVQRTMRGYAWLTLREAYRYFGRNRYILAEMIRGAPKRTRGTYNIEAYYDVEEEYHVVVSLMPDEWPGDDRDWHMM